MAATYQRVSGGRLLLNVVTGGSDAEQRRFGDRLSTAERYARTGEFLTILGPGFPGAGLCSENARHELQHGPCHGR